MRSSRNSVRVVACVIGLGLVVVQAALAADTQPIRFNAADQAAAKAVTVKAADLHPVWKGGARKPDLTPDPECSYKRSDLVLTGAAKSEFTMQGASITSESNVLQTPAMVAAEWGRSFGSSSYMACARKFVMNSDEPKVKFVSFKKIAFPKLAQYSTRYRMVADYGDAGSSVRLLVDVVMLGRGRTEISLILRVPYANRAAADLAERQLAKLLVSRITA